MTAPVVFFTYSRLAGAGMGQSADYRQNAAECLRLARSARSVEQKNILTEMAQTWAILAEQADLLEQRDQATVRQARRGVAGQ
jgi:hypothetical protein